MLVWAETFWEEERDEGNTFRCRTLLRKHLRAALWGLWELRSSGGREARHTPNREGLLHGKRDGRPCRAQGWTQLHESNPNPSAQSWPEHCIPAMMVAKASSNVRGPLRGPGPPLRLPRSAVTPAGSAQNHPSPYSLPSWSPHSLTCLPLPQSPDPQHLPQCLRPQPCQGVLTR